jgi:hypothetical protein
MRRLIPLLALILTAAGLACGEAEPVGAEPRLGLLASGRAEFQTRGASYGQSGDEMTNSACSATYTIRRDSVNWAIAGPPIWVQETSTDRHCNYWGGYDEDMRVGGNIGMYVEGDTTAYVGIVADQQSVGTITNVPTSGTTLYLWATPWDDYVFQHWRISNAAGTYVYFDCNSNIQRPADTQDYEFLAVFRENFQSPCGL